MSLDGRRRRRVGAVQLLCLGLLGEYVGRLYTQMQGRPSYYVAHDSGDTSGTGPADGDGDDAIVAQ